MIRVLQVVNNMHRAGLETMLMNYYRNMDKNEIQFDFLTHRPDRSDYDDEIESLGGKVYYAPRLYPQNYPAYFKWMKQFFEEHPEYQIVHSHIDSMSYLPLLAAKKSGVPVRIAHSHNTSMDRDFKWPLKMLFRKLLPSVATDFCTCGKEAGEFLFPGKQCTFIPNAIDTRKFLFNEELRIKKRKELDLEEKFVVGHVGRLSYQKNHKFLIEIFAEFIRKEPNAILLLVGVGEKEEELKKQVRGLGLDKTVIFLGNRSDINELYQAMDIFVMPSLFEGIPMVGVEAQFSGLPCLFSNKVPFEVAFTKKSSFLELNRDMWVNQLINYKRINRSEKINSGIYDINYSSHILFDYYNQIQLKGK